MADATVVAQKYGVTVDEARKIVAEMAREDQVAKLAAIKNELRGAGEEARGFKERASEASEETGRLGEVGGRAGEVLGSLRSGRHAIAGIVEVARGGTSALAGMATEGRVLTEVFESLIPGAGAFLAVFTLAQIALGMMEKSEDSAEKATDKATAAQDKQADSIKALEDQAAKSYPNILQFMQAISKEMAEQQTAAQGLLRAPAGIG